MDFGLVGVSRDGGSFRSADFVGHSFRGLSHPGYAMSPLRGWGALTCSITRFLPEGEE